MRIVLINKFPHVTGGADRHVLDLASVLERRGHDVALLSTSPLPSGLQGAGVPATVSTRTRDAAPPWERGSIALRGIWNRSASAAASHLLRTFRPHVAHAHKLYPQLSVAPVRVFARANVPIVQTVHDFEFVAAFAEDPTRQTIDRFDSRLDYRALNTALFQVKRRFHAPHVRHWIAVSRSLAAHYEEAGIPTTVLPNFTLQATPRVPGRAERRGIVFVGRLNERKGVPDVLELAAALPDIPVLIGGHGPLEGTVREACDALSNVTYLGQLTADDVQTHLLGSVIAVIPSRGYESGPLTCLEAMDAGTPSVVYDSGGLGEYVRNAGAGTVVPPDPAALIAACKSLYHDAEQWRERSANGRRAVSSVHSPDRYGSELELIYEAARAQSTHS